MNDDKPIEDELAEALQRLSNEHRELDGEIARLQAMAYYDQLLLQRLKKRKLWLKDTIVRIQSKLIPDWDA